MAAGSGRYFINYTILDAPGANGPYTASSVDGQAWILVPELRSTQGLAGGNGRLVALVGGQALVTTNGTTFTSAVTPADMFNPQRLFFAGGRFLAARTMHASTDGVSWARLATFTKPDTVDIRGVAYGAGR